MEIKDLTNKYEEIVKEAKERLISTLNEHNVQFISLVHNGDNIEYSVSYSFATIIDKYDEDKCEEVIAIYNDGKEIYIATENTLGVGKLLFLDDCDLVYPFNHPTIKTEVENDIEGFGLIPLKPFDSLINSSATIMDLLYTIHGIVNDVLHNEKLTEPIKNE